MKKTFKLTHPKIAPPRLMDAIRHEVKKYVRRERNKQLPANADFWDFDCRFGDDEDSSNEIHLSEISDCISKAETMQLESFYLEIIAKPGHRTAKTADENSVPDRVYLEK